MTIPPATLSPSAGNAPGAAATPPVPAWATRGSVRYRRISLALFLAGFSTFSLLYCVQPLLPVFAQEFGVGPAESSLSLSLSTGFLALAIFCAAAVSEALGRRGLMFGSMCGAALLNLALALAPGWHALLVLRALEGLVLGGVPAVAMAYLAEEIEPRGLGLAMGLYVAGTAFGGMTGRVLTGLVAEFVSWRAATNTIGGLGLLAACGFIFLLPASRNFVRRPSLDPAYHLDAWGRHLRHKGLPLLFATGFLVMGMFIVIYNYAGFRLTAPPYGLSQGAIGLLFTVYLFGIASSSIAGALADRVGRPVVLPIGLAIMGLGIFLTLFTPLAAVIGGIALLTIGFFIAHSVASGWVGRLAGTAKGHAASLYLLAYYLGSSVVGSAGGWVWAAGGWDAIVLFTAGLLALAILMALRLGSLARAAQETAPARIP
jgi:MFS transporter, YNFM family, putative membrane transport protein